MIGQAFLQYMMRRRDMMRRKGMLTGGLALPPLYEDVVALFTDRTGGVVNNKIDDTKNGELVGKKYYQSSVASNTYVVFNRNYANYYNHTVIMKNVIVDPSTSAISLFGATDENGKRYDGYFNITLSEFRLFSPTSTGSRYQKFNTAGALLNDGDLCDIKIIYNGLDESPALFIDDVEYFPYTSVNLGQYTPNKLYLFTLGAGIGNSTYASNCGIGELQIYNAYDKLYFNLKLSENYPSTNCYDIVNGEIGTIYNATSSFFAIDYTEIPYHAEVGCSIIDGKEVPPLLGTQVNALNGESLTNPATSKIVSNVDGYIVFPVVPVPGHASIFDKSDRSIYKSSIEASTEYYDATNPTKWHISELWPFGLYNLFVEAGFGFWWPRCSYVNDSGFEIKELNEIVVYDQKIDINLYTQYFLVDKTDASKGRGSLFFSDQWDDFSIWDDNLIWYEYKGE